jgi:dissimilatory sulfite reductase (desulfoviridin) alpha/beta subunit
LGIKGGYAIEWISGACTLCGACLKACRAGAITQTKSEILVDETRCNNCGRCVKACPADSWKAAPVYILSLGGTCGNLIAKGERVLPVIRDQETLFRVADAALAFFDQHGKPGERFRLAIERTGWGVFKAALESAYQG